MKRRKKTKRSSSVWLAAALLATFSGRTSGGEKKAVAAYAVVAVTVFREPGFALPGAEVSLTAGNEKPKKATCDARGEYAFRVAPEPKEYVVRATAKGFHAEEKRVAIHGESERAEVTLELHTEPK